MNDFAFHAIGTKWGISVDGGALPGDEKQTVLNHIGRFERRFSRFLPDSEVNAFRNAKAGEYEISDEFAILLGEAARLRTVTEGTYDPAAGELLERAGYDASYRMRPLDSVDEFVLPQWTLSGNTLIIDGPAAFDLGGIGKGYCIDKVAGLLGRLGHTHFIIDAGGDIYATSKKDGAPWKIAIQYPGKPDTAAGVVDLLDRAVAVSDSFRRRWGKWHHLLDPQKKKPVENIVGAAAVAPSAWHADCMTSVLFFAPPEALSNAAREYQAKYLIFNKDGTCTVSQNWEGELF